jgi:hypothetical protein
MNSSLSPSKSKSSKNAIAELAEMAQASLEDADFEQHTA